jgi:hypothetical protein
LKVHPQKQQLNAQGHSTSKNHEPWQPLNWHPKSVELMEKSYGILAALGEDVTKGDMSPEYQKHAHDLANRIIPERKRAPTTEEIDSTYPGIKLTEPVERHPITNTVEKDVMDQQLDSSLGKVDRVLGTADKAAGVADKAGNAAGKIAPLMMSLDGVITNSYTPESTQGPVIL